MQYEGKIVRRKGTNVQGKVYYAFQRLNNMTGEWSWILAVLIDGRTVDWPVDSCEIIEEETACQ
jgi:hypothetical protein